MTAKGTKELLTGDTATLVARALILLGLAWNGMNQGTTKENTEDIKITLTKMTGKQEAFEYRISRNETLDGKEHSELRQMVEQNRKDLQDFKDRYTWNYKPASEQP